MKINYNHRAGSWFICHSSDNSFLYFYFIYNYLLMHGYAISSPYMPIVNRFERGVIMKRKHVILALTLFVLLITLPMITSLTTEAATKANKINYTFQYNSLNYIISKSASAAKPGSVTLTGVKSNSLTSISIPKKVSNSGYTYQVTAVGKGAFRGNKKITKITVPSSVTALGDSVFWGCSKLVQVILPDSVKRLGSNLFWYCTSLKQVHIPSN
jgi:hypothetical protein